MDEHDLVSASKARAELDTLVPAVEDPLAAVDSQAGTTLLAGSLKRLLRDPSLDTVGEEFERALLAAESGPPVAITAARAAIESLLRIYVKDKRLAMPSQSGEISLLHTTAMVALGLGSVDKTDKDVRDVLQGLYSVVHGISDLRTHVGSARGRGRRSYRLQTRHARLTVHAPQTFVEFFIETWNYREGRSSFD